MLKRGRAAKMAEMIKGIADRDKAGRSYYTSNGYTYELHPDYGRFPDCFEFTMYSGGCCDKEDNLFLSTRDVDHPIMMLDPEGNYVKDFGKGLFKETHTLCVTPEDTLLCVDVAMHVLREISKDGELIRDIGTPGVPSDSGFDPDIWRKRQRMGKYVPTDVSFDKGWSFFMGVGTIRRAAPPFNKPTGVAFAPSGDLFVSDGYGNAAIHHFTRDGKLIQTWGGPGDEPGRFVVPHCLCVDVLGRVWVGDRDGNRLHVFSEDGELLAYFDENLYQPTGLWADRNYVYVAERGGGLTMIDMELNVKAQLGFYNSSIRAHGMCGNSRGELFLMPLTTYDRHFLMKLSPVAYV